ncbi:NACHT domain protein [Janthinobacterium sp. HH107]|uniref:NACHT domain-containing protein n=1 Tax=Janthinobacterium sp. HH107 TaxID=1537279 RepID=UPI000893A50F|nr:NACHT domain-containing protein [Janthinobacterium sp. HH107]OFA05352.1 NACHT domain protein [Janthinobacterium sp. HH107]
MAITGIEIAAARLFAPIIKELYSGAKGIAEEGFNKWKSEKFPQKLIKKISVADKVKTIWCSDKDISLKDFYYPSKLVINRSSTVIKSINDIGKQNIVVEGIVGQGKSIFLRYLCLQELSGAGSGRIPLFLELRSFSPGKNLKYYLFQALEKLDLKMSDDIFDYLAESGKIVLLLDGFDELNSDLVPDVISEMEFLSEKYESMQIIVTSRPENAIQKSRHFITTKIATLDVTDYSGFLKSLKISPTRRAEILTAIKGSPSNVSALINTPLMLTLLVMVYESEKEIPSELPEFFEKLFHVVFTKHDRLKSGFNREHYSGLSEKKLQILFETFCFMVIQEDFGRNLTSDQFSNAFSLASEYISECLCECESFKKDITKVSCLMLEEGFDTTSFLHKSILEYYAASFIKRASDDVASLYYDSTRKNSARWNQVNLFLQKIDSYRHAKYYLIPCIEEVLKIFDAHIKIKKTYFDNVLKIYPDIAIGYRQLTIDGVENENDYTPQMYGPFVPIDLPIGYLESEIQNAVVNALTESHPEKFRKSEIKERHSLFTLDKGAGERYLLLLKNKENPYDSKSFNRSIEIFINSKKLILNSAQEIVSNEERKKNIFQRAKLK